MAVPSSVGDVKYRGPLGRILHSNRCHPLKIKGFFFMGKSLEKSRNKIGKRREPSGSLGKGKSTARLALLSDFFVASPRFLPFPPTMEPDHRLMSDCFFLHYIFSIKLS